MRPSGIPATVPHLARRGGGAAVRRGRRRGARARGGGRAARARRRRGAPPARRAPARGLRPRRARPGRPRGLDRRAPALPEGHRPRRPPDGGAGGRAREADRARRPPGEAGDGRGEPAARRLDREALPQPRAPVPRPDPGGDDRARAGGGEVRLPQGLQVLHLRDLVDPPGGRACARRQGPHDPDAGARRREAEPDPARRAEAAGGAREGADGGRDRPRARADRRGGRADPPERPAPGLAREAGRRRRGLGVRALHRGRVRAAARREGGGRAAQRDARAGAADARRARAARARDALRAERQAAPHPRRGGPRVQRHPRAGPPDREPVAEEAARARRGADAPRRRRVAGRREPPERPRRGASGGLEPALPGRERLEVLPEAGHAGLLAHAARRRPDPVPGAHHPEPVVDEVAVEQAVLDERADGLVEEEDRLHVPVARLGRVRVEVVGVDRPRRLGQADHRPPLRERHHQRAVVARAGHRSSFVAVGASLPPPAGRCQYAPPPGGGPPPAAPTPRTPLSSTDLGVRVSPVRASPALDDLDALTALADPVRRRLYEVVCDARRPTGREAAAAAGLSRSLAAYHLDRLARSGLLEVSYGRPPGRGGPGAGRPAKLYRRASAEFALCAPPRDYALLAEILLRADRDDVPPSERAVGRELGRQSGSLREALRSRGYEPFADG